MRGKIALLISLLVIVSFISGCTTSEVFVNNNEFYGCIQEPVIMDEEVQSGLNQLYEQYLAECRQECPTCNCEVESKLGIALDLEEGWGPGLLGKEVTLPFTYGINRCLPLPYNRLNNADLGIDLQKCPNYQIEGDNPFLYPYYPLVLYYMALIGPQEGNKGCYPTSFKNQYLPPNTRCDLKETYLLVIVSDPEEASTLNVNGHQLTPIDFDDILGAPDENFYLILFYSGRDMNLFENEIPAYNGIPSTITITSEEIQDVDVFLYKECCWHCNPKPSLPATILYPKVDIESFTLNDGDAIIKDGKVVSSFTIAPGVQKPIIGVENRGFFTQNNVYIKFVGLPDGIEVSTTPELQKIKAHNIGTYETTFTVGPNVPSGTYKVSLIAYSPNGILDTIIMDLVVL